MRQLSIHHVEEIIRRKASNTSNRYPKDTIDYALLYVAKSFFENTIETLTPTFKPTFMRFWRMKCKKRIKEAVNINDKSTIRVLGDKLPLFYLRPQPASICEIEKIIIDKAKDGSNRYSNNGSNRCAKDMIKRALLYTDRSFFENTISLLTPKFKPVFVRYWRDKCCNLIHDMFGDADIVDLNAMRELSNKLLMFYGDNPIRYLSRILMNPIAKPSEICVGYVMDIFKEMVANTLPAGFRLMIFLHGTVGYVGRNDTIDLFHKSIKLGIESRLRWLIHNNNITYELFQCSVDCVFKTANYSLRGPLIFRAPGDLKTFYNNFAMCRHVNTHVLKTLSAFPVNHLHTLLFQEKDYTLLMMQTFANTPIRAEHLKVLWGYVETFCEGKNPFYYSMDPLNGIESYKLHARVEEYRIEAGEKANEYVRSRMQSICEISERNSSPRSLLSLSGAFFIDHMVGPQVSDDDIVRICRELLPVGLLCDILNTSVVLRLLREHSKTISVPIRLMTTRRAVDIQKEEQKSYLFTKMSAKAMCRKIVLYV